IFDEVYNSFSDNRMRFMGHVLLNRMLVLPELKSAYIYITNKDRRDFKEQFGDTENFVNMPLAIKGIVFSTIFIERDNFVKISFRSKGNFSVNDFGRKHFNGGGHINAAGGESYKTLQETIENFVSILHEYENELKNHSF
ncbi:DHHA1 domain-containing protein, partial [Bacteroidales bacterium OttesenSCG-928-I21]|nr:DHHA1 domain-containing protein [Bacteroidales bacterium OttesenSCG-928-I21]